MASDPTRRALTVAEAEALQARRPAAWDHVRFHGGADGFEACDGPLAVDGEFEPGPGVLVVLGDLDCDLLFVDDIASLIVTGRLCARAIIGNGGIYVFGDLECQTLVGLSYGDRMFGCHGHARVGTLIEDGHTFVFSGRAEVDVLAPVSNLVVLPADARVARDFRAGMAPAQMRDLFVDDVLGDEALDVDAVCSLLWDGRSPRR
ncbi:hypothetical protein [Luteimonas abyssi]|jgi:hypothetical protein|uniref:hypothetical protein n=1 Tax=Luteimonas abyssi TaxID=1247514 RepID=UPI000737C68B|nr:hypothetical protein [Luteimonas abyssi]